MTDGSMQKRKEYYYKHTNRLNRGSNVDENYNSKESAIGDNYLLGERSFLLSYDTIYISINIDILSHCCHTSNSELSTCNYSKLSKFIIISNKNPEKIKQQNNSELMHTFLLCVIFLFMGHV